MTEIIEGFAERQGVTLSGSKESAAAETGGGNGSKPAPEPPPVREPAHPGELIRTRQGAMDYAASWAGYYATLPNDRQDDFIVSTQAEIDLARGLAPEAYKIMRDAVMGTESEAA